MRVRFGLTDLAKFPFLKQTGQLVKDMGFTLEQIQSDPDFFSLHFEAMYRIICATKGVVYNHKNFQKIWNQIQREFASDIEKLAQKYKKEEKKMNNLN